MIGFIEIGAVIWGQPVKSAMHSHVWAFGSGREFIMKRLVVAVFAAVLLGLVPAALAAGTLSGSYKEKITGDPALGGALNGTWMLTFTPGHYKVATTASSSARARTSSLPRTGSRSSPGSGARAPAGTSMCAAVRSLAPTGSASPKSVMHASADGTS